MFMFVIILISALILWLKIYNKLICGTCKCSAHLVGKVVVVTGANTGIGFETAKDMAERGAKVILACRNEKLALEARDKITALTGNDDVHYRHLDLSSLRSVREFASNFSETEQRLDILINNAGALSFENKITEDGLHVAMQTNHFGPFLLTNLMLPIMKKTGAGRVVTVSSKLYEQSKLDLNNLNQEKTDVNKLFNDYLIYADTKLCNVLMTTELSRRLEGTGITTNCLHPGAVNTDILRTNHFIVTMNKLLYQYIGKTSWEGAQTTIYLAVSPEVSNVSGRYFSDCKEVKLNKYGRDMQLARDLWDKSEKLVKLK